MCRRDAAAPILRAVRRGTAGTVDIAKPFFFVSDVTFVFEHAKLRANGRVVRLTGQVAHHFGGRRASAPIEDVHDLTFTAGQRSVSCGRHKCYDHNTCVIKITLPMFGRLRAAAVATIAATLIAITNGQTSATPPASRTRAAEFLERLKLAVDSADRRAVSAMVGYPLTVLASGFNIPVKDTAMFTRMYDSVLTPELRCALVASEIPVGSVPPAAPGSYHHTRWTLDRRGRGLGAF